VGGYRYLSLSSPIWNRELNHCCAFSKFAAAVLADAPRRPVKRAIVDLRQNRGGDSSVINPLKSGLERRLGAVGHVYVLIGPGTFSSGTDNAMALRDSLHATLVGEPTEGKPSSYGEVKLVTRRIRN
jgi:C-terminal processing protease CtpA/Prc